MASNQLSFLPDDYLERKAQRRTNAICAVLFVIVLLGLGLSFTISEQASARLEDEWARVQGQRIAAARRIEQARQMQDKEKRMAHQAELSASLLEHVPRSYVLAQITNALPAGVSLLDLQMDSKPRDAGKPVEAPKTMYEQKKAAQAAASAAAAPLPSVPKVYDVTIKLTGVCNNDAQVAAFMSQLSKKDVFSDVNLLITDQYKHGNEDSLRKFQIELALNNDAEVEAEPAAKALTAVQAKE
jgi:Tfp pilus assembly protein PilN